MDVNNPGVPFFKEIKISTMARGEYVTYTLVNPMLTANGSMIVLIMAMVQALYKIESL